MTVTSPAMEMERVLRRFIPVISDINRDEVKNDLLGCVIDLETTGLDPEKDAVIELSIAPFRFNATGRVTAVGQALTFLEDPGMLIPPFITKLTGITDEMVLRKRIDDGAVCELARNAAIVIAHKADFDRPFIEKRLPLFKTLRFGCSKNDIAWIEEGYNSDKLEWLAYKHLGNFYDAHRADMDCYVALALLSSVLPSGMRALACVLDQARVSHVRLYATDSPFEYKDILKSRGYSWDADKKVWYRDVIVGESYKAEVAWLADNALCGEPKSVQFDSRTRFSNRIGKG